MLSSRWHFRHSCKFQTGIVQPLHYHRPREASSPFWETSQWPCLALKDMRSLKRVWCCLAVFTVCLVTCTQFERLPTCMMQWCKKDFFETVCVFEIGGVVILVDWLTCVCWKGNIILVLLASYSYSYLIVLAKQDEKHVIFAILSFIRSPAPLIRFSCRFY